MQLLSGAISKKKYTFKRYFRCFLVQLCVSRNSSIFSCQSHRAKASKTPTTHFPPPFSSAASCSWKFCACGPRQPLISPRFYHCHQPKPKTCPTPTPRFFPTTPRSPLRKTWFHGTEFSGKTINFASQKKSMRGILTDLRLWPCLPPNRGISHKSC